MLTWMTRALNKLGEEETKPVVDGIMLIYPYFPEFRINGSHLWHGKMSKIEILVSVLRLGRIPGYIT